MRYCNAPSVEDETKECGKLLVRKSYTNGKNEGKKHFETREVCDRTCQNRKRKKQTDDRCVFDSVCEVCGEVINRIRYPSGKWEPYSNYIRKKSHDECRGKLAYMTKLENERDVFTVFKENKELCWTWLTSGFVHNYKPDTKPRLVA
jgi:hypothetical protein